MSRRSLIHRIGRRATSLAGGAAPWFRRFGNGRLRVALYHDISLGGCPFTRELDVSTPPEVFEAHVQQLARDYDLVDLDAVVAGDLPERPLLITFDDAYRSVRDVAGPILRSVGAPSVFFVTTDPVFGRGIILDNLMSYVVSQGSLDDVVQVVDPHRKGSYKSLDHLFDALAENLSPARRSEIHERLCEIVGATSQDLAEQSGIYLDVLALRDLSEYGIEVGNHTASHVRCRSLDSEGLQREILAPQAELATALGCPVRAFSFPFGDIGDCTTSVRSALEASGHDSMFLVEGLFNEQRPDVYFRSSLGRLPTREISPELELRARLRRLGGRARSFAASNNQRAHARRLEQSHSSANGTDGAL